MFPAAAGSPKPEDPFLPVLTATPYRGEVLGFAASAAAARAIGESWATANERVLLGLVCSKCFGVSDDPDINSGRDIARARGARRSWLVLFDA